MMTMVMILIFKKSSIFYFLIIIFVALFVVKTGYADVLNFQFASNLLLNDNIYIYITTILQYIIYIYTLNIKYGNNFIMLYIYIL